MSENTSDKLLMKRLTNGDEAAFHALFVEYSTALTLFATKILKNEQAAMDVVQSVFVRLFESRNNLNIHTSLRSFLFQSVKNRCLNELKSEQIKMQHIQSLGGTPMWDHSEIEQRIYVSELEASMAKAIMELPGQCRRIFEMSRLEGKSNAEIAEQLHLSKRTVETQVSKALKFLRVKLSKWLGIIGWILFV